MREIDARASRQKIREDIVSLACPRSGCAGFVRVHPSRALGVKRALNFVTHRGQSCVGRGGCERAAIEKMAMDSVCEQRFVIGISLLPELAVNAAGTVAVLSSGIRIGAEREAVARDGVDVVGTREVAVGVVEQEFESAARVLRAHDAVFVLTFPEAKHDHVIDIVRDIEIRADAGIVGAQRLHARPGSAVAVVSIAGFRPTADVEVSVHGFVAVRRPAEVGAVHVGVPALAELIHAPVLAVEIQVDESRVRVERAHVEHRAVGENVRHIKAALRHVVRAAAEFERVKFTDRFPPARIAREEVRDFDIRSAE